MKSKKKYLAVGLVAFVLGGMAGAYAWGLFADFKLRCRVHTGIVMVDDRQYHITPAFGG